MFIEQFKQSAPELAETFSSEVDIDITFLHYIGERCEPGQKGHEATDDQNRILTCKEVSEGVFEWVDTGRIRS